MPSIAPANRPTDLLLGHEKKPEGSFLRRLSAEDWRFLLEGDLRGRSFAQDEHLPLGRDDRNVYMIWDGVVRQDRFPLGDWAGAPTVTRFRGGGQLVGEAKLVASDSAVRTRCLTRTVVIPCSARRFNVLLSRRTEVELALLRSLEDRNRSDELVYTLTTRSPLERTSRLLAHLADTAGTPDPRTGSTTITGPGQKDIAAALQLAVSTTENALRTLRYSGVIEARYRQFVVHDVDALRHLDAGN
ncbi:Crp/Fnr family transcriptional regulator [Streptomyces prunicolor]|uniref:Helix-turn-helix domain-containing protein n=1 Tax=Streptomyces prunicolor TaxID=67348 RepID=A0ABU4F7F9_9ACTN|nr:helix-turn-helix domain-containing protein [Streptomyces prunicolor]MDV7216529.1 helix-turn-helix domain-containing protein [Streptomyces prunicolor]